MGDAGGIRRNGLRVDRAKVEQWRRRSAERYAATLRARTRAAALTSRIARTKPSKAGDWTPAVRRAAAKRSGGVCEIDQVNEAQHLHHRKLRRHGDHRIVNALHVCDDCHRKIHAAPSWSYSRGFIVRAHLDPADVPVRIDVDTTVLLTPTGTYREAA